MRLLRCRFGPPGFYPLWEPFVILFHEDSPPIIPMLYSGLNRFRGTVSSKGPSLSELGSHHRKSCILRRRCIITILDVATRTRSVIKLPLLLLANDSNDHLENFFNCHLSRCKFFISKSSRWSIEIEFL